jgi:hypothetical protein
MPTLDLLRHVELRKDGYGDIRLSLVPFGQIAEVWILSERPETAAVLVMAEVMLSPEARRPFIIARIDGS